MAVQYVNYIHGTLKYSINALEHFNVEIRNMKFHLTSKDTIATVKTIRAIIAPYLKLLFVVLPFFFGLCSAIFVFVLWCLVFFLWSLVVFAL